MKHATVCALVPTYNRADYLGDCLRSLRAQTRQPDQIIVINDGSTDTTGDVVRAFGPEIQLLNKPNGGKASALNLGLQHSQADYIWICDDDDLAAPDGLEVLCQALDSHPEADIAFGEYRVFSGETPDRLVSVPGSRPRPAEPNPKILFLEGMFTNQFAMLVRRRLYEKVGPFREDMRRSQDLEMTLRLTRHATAIPVPRCIFYYRQHEGLRGTAAERFAARRNITTWATYEKKIYETVAKTYALDEFLPTFARNWPPLRQHRACQLQRAAVMARHALWPEALADMTAASDTPPDPLTEEERHLLQTVVTADHPWEKITNTPALRESLRTLARRNATAHALVFTFCHRFVRLCGLQLLRHRDIPASLRTARTLFRILGPGPGIRRVWSSFSGQ